MANLYAETLKNFRRVFVSSDRGVRKPEPEAFAKIATAIRVPLSRILFFDDTKENVEGALAVGMQAVHVSSVGGIAEAIAKSVGDLRRHRTARSTGPLARIRSPRPVNVTVGLRAPHAEGPRRRTGVRESKGQREFADPRHARKEVSGMVTITFPDRETEKRALGFLLGRFSGRVLRSGEHLVPEAALEALADSSIPFTVKGKATYEQQLAAVRGAASAPLQ